MGSDEDLRRLWSFPEDNPFATQRGTIPSRPSQEDVQVATNVLSKSDPEMPPHKLFEAPMPIMQLQDLAGCTLLVIPETQVGSPYYNPLFMPK